MFHSRVGRIMRADVEFGDLLAFYRPEQRGLGGVQQDFGTQPDLSLLRILGRLSSRCESGSLKLSRTLI